MSSYRKLDPPKIDHMYSVKVHIPRDRRTHRSRGFGFVRFYDKKDAEYAISRMDGKRVDGRDLRCSFAKYDRPLDEKKRSRTRSPPRYRSRSRSPRSRSRSPIRERSPSRSRSRSR